MSEAEIEALAREIAEKRTGMPAYLVDDETWASALFEARETYVSPEPLSPLRDAIKRARTIDPVEFIEAYNRARARKSPEESSPDA